ncbi:uncharacterized protein LOC129592536 isoform X1 [Paramacrobiotus metropolitanus]|uniref:uncharacterized protein LOC129592536 isoform X1 n=2 Tax=Paramacrobiotus metropolitanus TaxID=2943436 RepID=UPI002445FE69|nr:uncharacterized protein LOC129592536 isoform X1 [Paramacrobiotus metropolitanus]
MKLLFVWFACLLAPFAQHIHCQPALPLGKFIYLPNNFPIILPPAPAALSTIPVDIPGLSRKLADNGAPADVAFEMSCAGARSNAKLNCPCSGVGQPCADPLSVCSSTKKCICDSSVGFPDSTGTKCQAYATYAPPCATKCPVCPPVTTCPVTTCPTTTCPATTCPTTKLTTSPTTCPACPTTTTTTTMSTTTTTTPTTTTTTTTAPPSPKCAAAGVTRSPAVAFPPNSVITPCGKCIFLDAASTSNTFTVQTQGSYVAYCTWIIIAPPGTAITISSTNFAFQDCSTAFVYLNNKQYCGTGTDKWPSSGSVTSTVNILGIGMSAVSSVMGSATFTVTYA